MRTARRRSVRAPGRWLTALALALTLIEADATGAGPPPAAADPFARFDLPDAWESSFWGSPNARALLALSPRAMADLVPTQAGVHFCRCPACDADESDNPLAWSLEKPRQLTCRRCGVVVPNDKFPARNEKKAVPEETVEVLPGVVHHYPYHEVEPNRQRYPGERLYLAAKCDDEARAFLAKAALYAAVRYHEQPPGRKDPALARVACVLLVRFAQVYPAYSTHDDQPASPKYFDKADLLPPYRHGYRTAKWEWTGSGNVPLNLVVAYALLRGDPAMAEAGRLLGVADPSRAVEHDLFRASAEFVRRQPEEFNEASLQADRGLLAVGRLLNDPALVHDAVARLERFARRGFYYDGFWRQGSLAAHRRVLAQLDGWIGRLLSGPSDPTDPTAVRLAGVPMLALAHAAGSAVLTDPPPADVRQAAWPAPTARDAPRTPTLLGGTGLARLAVGQGDDALDLELRSLDAAGPGRIQRQALRLAVGGHTVLGDLDEGPGLPSGWERASVSRNTVVVDGLNQRESMAGAQEPAPGGDFLFFAADPDFQVVALDDPRAYPQSTTRYRQTLVASAGSRGRYALSVFEVHGGLQHDQIVHGPSGAPAPWELSVPTAPGPATLLPAGLTYVPTARADDGRWFVQSYGEFTPTGRAEIRQPAQARWGPSGAGKGGVRLHLVGDTPMTAVTATSPSPGQREGRASLVLRRRSGDGSGLRTTFVTVFEPISGAIPPLTRVGRVASPAGTVVVYVETAEGPEHVVVNLAPGVVRAVALADGRTLTTDGLAVRVSKSGLVLAGGTFAEFGGRQVRQPPAGGRVTAAVRNPSAQSRGWFEADTPLSDPETLAGRVILIRHGDGTTHGWTLSRVENTPDGARLHVREEPGFEIEAASRAAHFYQYPQVQVPGPHQFRVSRVARTGETEPFDRKIPKSSATDY